MNLNKIELNNSQNNKEVTNTYENKIENQQLNDNNLRLDELDKKEPEIEKTPEELLEDYKEQLKEMCPDIESYKQNEMKLEDFKPISPEERKVMHEEFEKCKAKLRTEWEQLNNKEWPKYTEDVVNDKGVVIRLKGMCYDAHHEQPLCLGGKNEATNIVPMHVNEHYDSVGIHSKDSPLTKLKESMED